MKMALVEIISLAFLLWFVLVKILLWLFSPKDVVQEVITAKDYDEMLIYDTANGVVNGHTIELEIHYTKSLGWWVNCKRITNYKMGNRSFISYKGAKKAFEELSKKYNLRITTHLPLPNLP